MSKKRTINKLENSNFSTVIIDLLNKYFTKKRAEIFVKKINDDPLTYNFIDPLAPSPKSFTDIINDKFSIKFRLLVDKITSFAVLHLSEVSNCDLLNELVRLSTVCYEFDLAKELSDIILSEFENKTEFQANVAYTHLYLSDLFISVGSWKEVEYHLKKARGLFEKEQDLYGSGYCEVMFAVLFYVKGEIDTSKIRLENAATICANTNSKKLTGLIQSNLGLIFLDEGNFEDSKKYFDNAESTLTKDFDAKIAIQSQLNLGAWYADKMDLDNALLQIKTVIQYALSHRAFYPLSLSLTNLAEISLIERKGKFALEYASQSLEIATSIKDKTSMAYNYLFIGIANKMLEDFPTSEDYFLMSMNLSKNAELFYIQAESAFELAKLYKETNRKKEANKYFEEALEYYKKNKIQSKVDEINSYL